MPPASPAQMTGACRTPRNCRASRRLRRQRAGNRLRVSRLVVRSYVYGAGQPGLWLHDAGGILVIDRRLSGRRVAGRLRLRIHGSGRSERSRRRRAAAQRVWRRSRGSRRPRRILTPLQSTFEEAASSSGIRSRRLPQAAPCAADCERRRAPMLLRALLGSAQRRRESIQEPASSVREVTRQRIAARKDHPRPPSLHCATDSRCQLVG